MEIRIVIKGKEVTHPLAKLGIGLVALLLMIIMVADVLFLVLPIMETTLLISMGIFLAIATSLLILILAIIQLLRWYNARDRLLDNEHHSHVMKRSLATVRFRGLGTLLDFMTIDNLM